MIAQRKARKVKILYSHEEIKVDIVQQANRPICLLSTDAYNLRMVTPYDIKLAFVQKITFVLRKINKYCCH